MELNTWAIESSTSSHRRQYRVSLVPTSIAIVKSSVRCRRNVFILGCAFFFNFTSFMTLECELLLLYWVLKFSNVVCRDLLKHGIPGPAGQDVSYLCHACASLPQRPSTENSYYNPLAVRVHRPVPERHVCVHPEEVEVPAGPRF